MADNNKPVLITSDARGRCNLKVARKSWIYRVVSSSPEGIVLAPVGPAAAEEEKP